MALAKLQAVCVLRLLVNLNLFYIMSQTWGDLLGQDVLVLATFELKPARMEDKLHAIARKLKELKLFLSFLVYNCPPSASALYRALPDLACLKKLNELFLSCHAGKYALKNVIPLFSFLFFFCFVFLYFLLSRYASLHLYPLCVTTNFLSVYFYFHDLFKLLLKHSILSSWGLTVELSSFDVL